MLTYAIICLYFRVILFKKNHFFYLYAICCSKMIFSLNSRGREEILKLLKYFFLLIDYLIKRKKKLIHKKETEI